LAELQHAAAQPAAQAHAMPPGLYCSDDVYRLEQERIFRRGWLCAGRAAEIPNVGDYLTFSVADQPILVVRGTDKEIRTYSNVCLHRMMVLAEGRGNLRSIVCPYHAWTYDLNGWLTGAGQMQHSVGFKKSDYRLPKIRTELWYGWIYITLHAAAPSIRDRLAPLNALVERYGMADYIPIIQQDHVWQTNWKLQNENFMEGYHGPFVHRDTVGAGVSVADTSFPAPCSDAFTFSTFTKPAHAVYGRAHPENQRLEGQWRCTSILPTVFPTHSFSLAPDYLWYLSLRPKRPGEVAVRIGVSLAPENHADAIKNEGAIQQLETFFDRVNAEDRAMVEGLYRGVQAPLASGGALSWLEHELHDLTRYLARTLT
jgi:phenylpropionate dioxygenase-like ring-hydroxylating dioxygenase large terminal subunit